MQIPPEKLKELLAAANPPLWTFTLTGTLPPITETDWYGVKPWTLTP